MWIAIELEHYFPIYWNVCNFEMYGGCIKSRGYLGEKSNTRDGLITKIWQTTITINNDLANIQWTRFACKKTRDDYFEQFVFKIDNKHFGVLFLKKKELEVYGKPWNCVVCVHIYVLLIYKYYIISL